MKKKIFSILFIAILLFFAPQSTQPAEATDVAALVQRVTKLIADLPGTIATIGKWVWEKAQWAYGKIAASGVVLAKIAALEINQQLMKAIIGDGNDGTIIRDFNNYLYVSPQQRAMAQMNSFFNTVSRGRFSSLNYEGVGPNYDAYLIAQARQSIMGQSFETNLQEQATEPAKMFDGGNMKGIMTYMQCANNVACYTLVSSAQYQQEFSKAQEIAKNENVSGFVPKKVNGRITQPAALAQNVLLQIDQLGTQLIMNAKGGTDAENLAAYKQIAMGASISLTARLTNYGISDKEGQEAIRNKNDEAPFSLAYNAGTGFGISAGGVTASLGVGAIDLQTQIGNTCVKMGGNANASGVTVNIGGKIYNCATKAEVTGTAPDVKVTDPSITLPQ